MQGPLLLALTLSLGVVARVLASQRQRVTEATRDITRLILVS